MSEGRRTEIMEHMIDTYTCCVRTMEFDHHEAHEGHSFSVSFAMTTTVADGKHVGLYLSATTGLALPYLHLRQWDVSNTGGAVLLEVLEAAVAGTVIGTTITPVNNNRPLSSVAGYRSGVTVVPRNVNSNTTTVFLLRTYQGGTNNQGKVGSLRTPGMEFILDRNKAYAVKATNLAGGVGRMSINLGWYQAVGINN